MPPTTADPAPADPAPAAPAPADPGPAGQPPVRRRPSLLWLLLVPAVLITGIGSAVALAAVTFAGVLDRAVDFGPTADLEAGEVTVWVAVSDGAQPPQRVRLLGPDGAEVPLTPVDDRRTVTADGTRWAPAYTATIRRPGTHRVEATGGRAALRATDQVDSATVRRNGIVVPLVLATASLTISAVVVGTVLFLRAAGRHSAPAT